VNRNTLSAWMAGAMILCALPAQSQSLGQFGGATPLPMNAHTFGTYVDATSHEVGFVTQLRMSFYPNVDFGFQGGLKRLDYDSPDGNALRLGTDVKFAAGRVRSGFPVDLAFGAGLSVDTGDNLSTLTVGPNVIASRGFATGSSAVIEPYASLGIAYASVNAGGQDDTGNQFPLRLGAEFRFTPDMRFVLEYQHYEGTRLGDRDAFSIGATFPF
jgi:hypothetical protein